jgi:hypothetical protein
MKFNKIASVLGSIALVGSSIGLAVAMAYPSNLQNSNGVALVYGENSAVTDYNAAMAFSDKLSSYVGNKTVTYDSEFSLEEYEVVLGQPIKESGDLKKELNNNRLPYLLDERISWDDGTSASSNFDIHEEILLGNMTLKTTLDDEDLNQTSLSNDKDLEYRYIFDDAIDISKVGHEDADTLKLTILGKEYTIEEMEETSITVSHGDEKILKAGDTISYEGVSLKIDEIFEDSIWVNGVVIKEGKTKKVDGIEVYAENIMYHDSSTLTSKVQIKIGKDLSVTYYDGDSYYDTEDSEWVWTIKDLGKQGGYIGVKYDLRQVDSDDNLVTKGKSYVFPENYTKVTFDGLNNVSSGKFKVYFDDSEDLYYNIKENNTIMYDGSKVLVIEGPEEDSFTLGDIETNKIYLKFNNLTSNVLVNPVVYNWVEEGSILVPAKDAHNSTGYFPGHQMPNGTTCLEVDGGINFYNLQNWGINDSICEFQAQPEVINTTLMWKEITPAEYSLQNTPLLEVFAYDVDKDYSSSSKPRFVFSLNNSNPTDVGYLEYGDTNLKISFDGISRELSFGNSEGLLVKVNPDGDFEYLGSDDREAEGSDVVLRDVEIGEWDNDFILDYSGLVVKDVESNANEDEVEFEVSDDTVYGKITISDMSHTIPDEPLDVVVVKDTEIDSVKNRDLIIVGGSCINKAAAQLLGVPENTCGEAFTNATGKLLGEYLTNEYVSPYNSERFAILVAGYEASDTTNAVNSLVSQLA